MAFRKKEPWMAPGSVVCIPSGIGTLEVVVECIGSTEFLPLGTDHRETYNKNFYQQETMVLQVYVKPEGVQHAWPYNPWDIDRVAA